MDQNQVREGLDASNLLLRGCTLRKTPWIIGAAVFTGVDTKIQRNQSTGKRKVTQLERHMNILVVVVFLIQAKHHQNVPARFLNPGGIGCGWCRRT